LNLIVDANILFSYFWNESTTKEIITKYKINLYSPELAIKEIKKYSKEIQQKTNISLQEFEEKLEELKQIINFIEEEKYIETIKRIIKLITNESTNEYKEFLEDIDFLGLAYQLNCPLWTNDKLLKKQNIIEILTTKELIELLPEIEKY